MFDSILVFENYPVNSILSSKDWSLDVENIQFKTQTNYPLTLIIGDAAEIIIGFSYNTELWKKDYIDEVYRHFENVLHLVIENDGKSLGDIELLTKPEKSRLISEFNHSAEYPRDKTIVSLFEEQVKKTPDNVAVSFEDHQLTYRELNERSNQFALYLQSKGVKNETLIPLCIERSIEMITAILGISKAGGVYVPVDPEYPEDRISYILEDTSASIVVSSSASKTKLPLSEDIDVIEIDKQWDDINQYSKDNFPSSVNPKNAAYIIYTSGSTGKPKGVIVEHRNVVRLFKTDSPLFDFTEDDVWTMFHSFCFDFSVWEMYGALFYGGRVVIVQNQVAKDPTLFLDLLISEKVTILNQIPSAFYVLLESILDSREKLNVRYVIFGGEALDPAKLRSWKETYPDSKLINMYGITETTVHVTYQEIDEQHIKSGNSIIGKPIPTLTLHILDKDQNLLPLGIAGELCIGGAGLSRGYLNRPELTAEKFIKDPFSNEPGARLYRSGDLGMRLPDGNIEYLGRIDEQVKIRGFRIELGEIESVLNEYELVNQAIVLSKKDKDNNKWLVAYIVPEGKFERDEIISYLRGKLPDYMVPGLWVELNSFPLTPSGKINKKALPDPDASALDRK